MAELKSTERALFKKLMEEFGLTKDHFFTHRHYTIITRSGIDRIQAKAKIRIKYSIEPLLTSLPDGIITMKAYGWIEDEEGKHVDWIETFGECSPDNNSNSYPIAMAEKRAMSRTVLKLAGLYSEDVFGEDEADDFKKSKPKRETGVVDKRL